MAPWTDVEKAFCVRLYTKTGSILQTQQKFRHYFNLRRCPAKNSIFRWSNKFEMFGSTENRRRKRAGQATNSGRPKTKTTPENAAIVFQSVQADHEKSIRRRSQELSLSRSSVHRILHSNLQMQSFSLQVKQRLNDQDKGQRVPCASGSVNVFVVSLTFLTMWGSRTKPIFIWTCFLTKCILLGEISTWVCSRTAPSRGEMYCLGCYQYSRNYWPHLVCRRREWNNDNQRRALHGRVEAILRQTEKKTCRCGLPMVHAGWGYSPHCELYPSVAQIKVPGPNHQ